MGPCLKKPWNGNWGSQALTDLGPQLLSQVGILVKEPQALIHPFFNDLKVGLHLWGRMQWGEIGKLRQGEAGKSTGSKEK